MRRRRGLSKRYGRAVHPPMPDMSWLHGGATGTLHERAAKALGWSVADARSMSYSALREAVRHVNPGIANEISMAIESGSHIKGKRYGRATASGSKWEVLLNGKVVDAFHYAGSSPSAAAVQRAVDRGNAWYNHEGGTLTVRRAG